MLIWLCTFITSLNLIQEPFFSHPFLIEHLAHITATMVMEQYHHHIFLRKMFLKLQDSFYGGTCGISQKHGLLPCQALRIDCSILVRYLRKSVYNIKMDILWQDILPYTFGNIWINLIFIKNSRLMILFKDRSIGIYAPYLDLRILFL